MERHSPKNTPFVLSAAESTVYEWVALTPPAEVPISIFNTGDTIIRWRVQGDANYAPLEPGGWRTFNPSGNVYATVDAGSGNLLVSSGIRAGNTGISSTGVATKTELSALSFAHGQKELLAMILLQAQLTNEHLSRINDEQLFERDLSPSVLGSQDD